LQQGLPQAISLADYQAPDDLTVYTDIVFVILEGLTELTRKMDMERQNVAGSEL